MERIALIALALLALSGAASQAAEPVPIDNTTCVALNDPDPCCSDANAGSCPQKSRWPVVWFSWQITNLVEGIWSRSCADAGDGDDAGWLVDNAACVGEDDPFPHCIGAGQGGGVGACTLAEHDAGTIVRAADGTTQTCTSARVTSGQCDSDFEGDQVPKLALAQKAFDFWWGEIMFKRFAKRGYRTHEELNAPAAGDAGPTGKDDG